jgi:tetratricopeptide (TPR) repeat protein
MNKFITLSISAFLFSIAFAHPALAADDPVGQLISSYGQVFIASGSSGRWQRAEPGHKLYPGSTVRTGSYSGASLRMEDESLMRLSQNSEFTVEDVRVSSFWRAATALAKSLERGISSSYRLLKGKLWSRNNNRGANARVVTATATIGIRGTEYVVEADESGSRVSIQEGAVEAKNELGELIIHSGEQALIAKGSVPAKSRIVAIGQSVQWTIMVPDLVDVPHHLKRGFSDKKAGAGFFDAYEAGQYSQAMESIKAALSKAPGNDDLKLLQHWIEIKAGDPVAGNRELLGSASANPLNIGLQELAALSTFLVGDIDKARKLLERLRKDQLISDSGWVVQGYIHQASYHLDAAARAYQQALSMNPENNIARIQLATIHFGSERPEQARALVAQALRQDPANASALTLKGFLQLADNENDGAIQAWQQALASGAQNADAYFGLSLANMRLGHVEDAMQHIATAVLLDPQRAMYLSYWGKMLHQIGRQDKALTVLDSAIRLDPNDPTPRLYKAIILRDLNRPGEAIVNIQDATRLNDNRGVYRSRSLLDKDLAVQNVDLSRLYTQLGLSDWAHKKAMESIKADYANATAHIINAGAYRAMGDRTYAQASEALLARIMQPANINAFSSFNSYTSLYESPDTEFNLSLEAGNHKQQSANLIIAGGSPENQIAWIVSALKDETDGWRDTNGESVDSLDLIGKWQPSQKNNFLFTLSSSSAEVLDPVFPRFEIDSTSRHHRQQLDSVQIEFGLHHTYSARSDLMLYLSHIDRDGSNFEDNTVDFGGGLIGVSIDDFRFEKPLTSFQVQGTRSYDRHQVFYGALLVEGNTGLNGQDTFGFNNPTTGQQPVVTPINTDLDISLTSLYLQDSWKVSPSVQLDIAAYLEEMDNANPANGGIWTIKETTGRLGLKWKAAQQHTIRLAAFEYLLPFTIARLDPTDVAGVPIFKNTREGSLVEEADLVWDFEWDRGLVSTTLFTLEGSATTAQPDANGIQVKTTSTSEKAWIWAWPSSRYPTKPCQPMTGMKPASS